MTPFIIFILSLIAMVALFVLKYKESQKDCVFFAKGLRESCDIRIMHVESHCSGRCTRANALHVVRHIYNTLAHKFAKVTASIAKKVEWRARSVAHKSAKARQGGEEARENGYLKDVQEYKDSLDTAKVAEEAKL